jgi:hypothetical protein
MLDLRVIAIYALEIWFRVTSVYAYFVELSFLACNTHPKCSLVSWANLNLAGKIQTYLGKFTEP